MYLASETRYDAMPYNRLGSSGLKLPAVSLGLWHNFGNTGRYDNMQKLCFTAFDHGITHFDLANNYGPPEGSAEQNFGRILKEDLRPTGTSFSFPPRQATGCGPAPTATGAAGSICCPAWIRV